MLGGRKTVIFEFLGTGMTVSYTHLDVYKRQILNRINEQLNLRDTWQGKKYISSAE